MPRLDAKLLQTDRWHEDAEGQASASQNQADARKPPETKTASRESRAAVRRPHHLRSRRAGAQPQERRPDDPARQAGGLHGLVGFRQVLPGLRHDLRGGPTPLRRIPLGLRPPVPRNDAEAGRRPDRRPLARHLDRAEDDLEEPAFDRRHGHRDLRLHAAAVGAGRHPLFAGDRPADREPDGQPDGRPRHRPARAHAALSAGAGDPRPQGRVPKGNRRLHEEGLPAAQDRRPVLRNRRRTGAGQEAEARHRRRGGSHCRARRHQGPPVGEFRDRARSRRRHCRDGICLGHRRQGPAETYRLLIEIRVPRLRLHDFGDRAPAVLVQQPIWRLPGMRRPGRRAAHRCRADRARRAPQPAQRRHRALGQVDLALLHADAGGAWPRLQVPPRRRLREAAPRDPAHDLLRLRPAERAVLLCRRRPRL